MKSAKYAAEQALMGMIAVKTHVAALTPKKTRFVTTATVKVAGELAESITETKRNESLNEILELWNAN